MNQTLLFWIVACILFTLLEAFTQQFVSIWLLSGSVVAMLAAYFGFDIEVQWILFVVVSMITLIAFRPVVKKFVQGEVVATNSDYNIGKLAIVTTEFDGIKKEGRVFVNDMDWAAKSLDDIAYKKGDRVIVEKIEGVKCLVRKA